MGSTASTNNQHSSLGHMIEFVGVDDKYVEHASLKRKRHSDKMHQTRQRRDIQRKRKMRQRSKKVMNGRNNNNRPSSRNNIKELPSNTCSFASRQDFKKMKSDKKSLLNKGKEESIFDITKENSNEKKIKMNHGQFNKNKDKIERKLATIQPSKLYDLTANDENRIYDLRTLYTAVNKKKPTPAKETRDVENEVEQKSNNIYNLSGKTQYENRKYPPTRPRSKTLNLTDQRNMKQSTYGNDSEAFSKRKATNYASLRITDGKNRKDKSRFSLRFSGKTTSKEVSTKVANNKKKDKKISTGNVIGSRIDSYLTSTLQESDVSFHMQGAPRNGHVVLASPSTITLTSTADKKYHNIILQSDFNKENKDNQAFKKNSHGNEKFGSKLYTRTVKQIEADKWKTKLDPMIEEVEENIYEDIKTKVPRNNIRINSLNWKSKKPLRFVFA